MLSNGKDEREGLPIDDDYKKQKKIQRLRNFEIHPILPSSLQSDSIELIDAIVLNVNDKSFFSSLLRILPPLPSEFEHLKRVNGTQLLVTVGLQKEIGINQRAAIVGVLGTEPVLTIRQIPRGKPQSKAQLDIYRKKWPMSFHKNVKLEAMISGTLFTETERLRISQLFAIAERTGAALFYDSESDQIVAEGRHTDKTPLAHAVLNAIDHLSAKQRAKWGNNDSNGNTTAQYLATGFYAILASEPCTMCAMALVHVRVGRVFFGSLNAKSGAFCSKWRLQESPHINHHFDVFQIVEKASS